MELYTNGHAIDSWSSWILFIVLCNKRVVVLHFTVNFCNKSCIFFKDLLSWKGSSDRIKTVLSGARVAITSKVRASAMLVLRILGN
jgi:hypothetical protein